jgi:hypothetical protein
MHTDETIAASWVYGVVETLYKSFKAGESVTLPGFGDFYVRSSLIAEPSSAILSSACESFLAGL